MSKSGKRKTNKKKNLNSSSNGSFKVFVSELLEAMDLLKLPEEHFNLSRENLRLMYETGICMKNPVRGNDFIQPIEVRTLGRILKRYYRRRKFPVGGARLTLMQIGKLCSLFRWEGISQSKKSEKDPALEKVIKEIEELIYKDYCNFWLECCFNLMAFSSNPSKKYYSFEFNCDIVENGAPKLVFYLSVSAYPAREYGFTLGGIYRPAYRLGYGSLGGQLEWVNISRDQVKDHYKGEKQEIEVFIQSHALHRIKERLDYFNDILLNYWIFWNTIKLKGIQSYKDYLLIPFEVFDIKVGYFAATILDEKLLIRSFLFLTHSSTPEGDKLKELTGLGKYDVSYWRIDRYSTFMGLKEKEYPHLKELFSQAGLQDLFKLREFGHSRDKLLANPFDELMAFLERGRKAEVVQEKEWMDFLEFA
ncbi:hypothetical protein [Marinilabilia rubra]|uniref:Uncharacterized protein n=1 Tax=Marinilabilia rubra TaxID=2162893 RepID=A0A2U2BAW9_9BACT|nr:hypothetical protein [Marinilabilia rubra]PWE00206.1 hypothetical protein DDZ16_07600 [Marinilabilia rubra]